MGLGFEPTSLTPEPSWIFLFPAHTKSRAASYEWFFCIVDIQKLLYLLGGPCLSPCKGSSGSENPIAAGHQGLTTCRQPGFAQSSWQPGGKRVHAAGARHVPGSATARPRETLKAHRNAMEGSAYFILQPGKAKLREAPCPRPSPDLHLSSASASDRLGCVLGALPEPGLGMWAEFSVCPQVYHHTLCGEDRCLEGTGLETPEGPPVRCAWPVGAELNFPHFLLLVTVATTPIARGWAHVSLPGPGGRSAMG